MPIDARRAHTETTIVKFGYTPRPGDPAASPRPESLGCRKVC